MWLLSLERASSLPATLKYVGKDNYWSAGSGTPERKEEEEEREKNTKDGGALNNDFSSSVMIKVFSRNTTLSGSSSCWCSNSGECKKNINSFNSAVLSHKWVTL